MRSSNGLALFESLLHLDAVSLTPLMTQLDLLDLRRLLRRSELDTSYYASDGLRQLSGCTRQKHTLRQQDLYGSNANQLTEASRSWGGGGGQPPRPPMKILGGKHDRFTPPPNRFRQRFEKSYNYVLQEYPLEKHCHFHHAPKPYFGI